MIQNSYNLIANVQQSIKPLKCAKDFLMSAAEKVLNCANTVEDKCFEIAYANLVIVTNAAKVALDALRTHSNELLNTCAFCKQKPQYNANGRKHVYCSQKCAKLAKKSSLGSDYFISRVRSLATETAKLVDMGSEFLEPYEAMVVMTSKILVSSAAGVEKAT